MGEGEVRRAATRRQIRDGYEHESLDRVREVVLGLGHERVEGVAQAAAAEELERGAPHPREDVEVLWTVLDLGLDRRLELRGRGDTSEGCTQMGAASYPLRDVIK